MPPEASGRWWVLHRAEDSYRLVPSIVAVDAIHDSCLDGTPGERSGRRVRVPGVAEPVLLLRGIANLQPGQVRSASLPSSMDGFGKTLSVGWAGRTVEFRHVTAGDGFRVELADGERVQILYENDWHDDGSWSLIWAGDLNGDGHLDVFLNATHKYSVYTARLLLSRVRDGTVVLEEVASFTHTAC
ncbi:MAG: hypothetical protein GY953_53745 [bacterium]|nr:hypothetical protein [bacterium]